VILSRKDSSRLGRAVLATNWIFAIIFAIEVVLKCMTLCLFQPKGAYLRNKWHVMDFVVTVLTTVALAVPSVSFLRSLRAVRALRLLSVSSRSRYAIDRSCFPLVSCWDNFESSFIRIKLLIPEYLSVVAMNYEAN
jgi:hypothetical protein